MFVRWVFSDKAIMSKVVSLKKRMFNSAFLRTSRLDLNVYF